ncbi:site-specific integrase [Clostridium perfringens]|uniref:site-specific integrase n=1 Tax=Clostridium perfringens TaxID=1502 RepID=UPI0024BC2FBD|nr:site-specific integrase [Clostridium perfringens]
MDYNITYREKDKGIQYIISYKNELGKWKQKSKQGFQTKRDAKKAALEAVDKLKEELKYNLKINTYYKDMTLKEFIPEFIEHKRLYVTANTINMFYLTFDAFSTLNDIKLIDITNFDIQKCVDEMIKKNQAYLTIKTRVGYLKSFFNTIINEFNITIDNPIKSIKYPKNKKNNDIFILNEYEINDILKKLEGTKYYLIVKLAATCGLRIGEILGLTWDNIDFQNSKIKINKQWKIISSYKEDGQKEKMGFGDLKAKNSNRTVPIPHKTLKDLKEYYNSTALSIDGRLFPFAISRSFQRGLNIKLKKIGYKVSIHDFRHYYATKLISSGVDFKTTANLLGHEVEMTMKIYSHVNDDMFTKANNVIQNIF